MKHICRRFGLHKFRIVARHVLRHESVALILVSRFAKTASIAPNDPIHRSKAKMFPKLMPTRFD